MRILLLTDSLGCPRREINVDNTWTDRIIKKWSSHDMYFYTHCKHGLSLGDIDITYINEIEPDVIIMQVGVVDASRRALSRKEVKIISKLPLIRTIVKKICNKFHYRITKVRNINYCSLNDFKCIIKKIINETGACVVFLKIAPPGKTLKRKVYNIQNDIDKYNNAIKENCMLRFLDPYVGNVDDYILESDGHHLNLRGEEMVFCAVDRFISEIMEENINV
ncbi:MAG: hypothetical protein J6H31_03860 [Butyrivibrio sp.]|nr:hypothetical protein [Butyrivibrio sp.]